MKNIQNVYYVSLALKIVNDLVVNHYNLNFKLDFTNKSIDYNLSLMYIINKIYCMFNKL